MHNNLHLLFYLQIKIKFYLNYSFLKIYILMDLIILTFYKIQKQFKLFVCNFLNLFWSVIYRERKLKSSIGCDHLQPIVNMLGLKILNCLVGCFPLRVRIEISNRLMVSFLYRPGDKVKPRSLSDCLSLLSAQL